MAISPETARTMLRQAEQECVDKAEREIDRLLVEEWTGGEFRYPIPEGFTLEARLALGRLYAAFGWDVMWDGSHQVLVLLEKSAS